MDDYVGHLREFRRILSNLESQSSAHPLTRETIVALTQKLDRDESQLNADRLERSIRATVEATRTLGELQHYEQEVLSVFQEIASRKRRELERRRFRKLLDHSGDSILIVEPNTGRFLDVNESAARTLGYAREELLELSLNHVEVGLPFTPASAWERWVDGLRTSGPAASVSVEGAHRRKNGERFPVEASVSLVLVDEQELLLVVARDVSERKQAENRIRRQWAFFSRLVHRSVDGILAFDRNLTVTYWNPAAERLLGVRRAKVIGENLLEALPSLKELDEDRYFKDALAGTIAISRNRPFTNAETGRPIYFDGYYSPLSEDGGEVLGGIGILRDVTERREMQLRQSRETMAHLDQQRLAQLDVQQRLESELADLKVENERLMRARERSEDAEAKERLRSERVEGLEVFAGGLAREVVPLMTGILSQTGIALAELPSDSHLRRGVEEIEKAALSTSALASTLSRFSGNGHSEGERISVVEVLSEVEPSLRNLVAPGIAIELPSDEESLASLPAIMGDGRELRDLLLALVQNAAEAVGEGRGKGNDGPRDADSIRIEAGTMDVDALTLSQAYLGKNKLPGKYVYVEVSDSGVGMDSETLARALVPFFTTKRGRRGLGLAAVLGALRNCGGAIFVSSEPGEGSVFRALFPLA